MREIVVEPYNEEWKKWYKELKHVYKKHLVDIDVQIEHVGSTSVKGLAAKPIIDIDIIVEIDEDVPRVIHALSKLGYNHQGDLGIKGREAFKRENEYVPYDKGRTWVNHHLYVCKRGIPSLENHLLLRDYLREHEDAVIEYGQLKKRLALLYPYDIDSYIEGKTNFITSILSKLGMSDQINEIKDQNKKNK